MNDKCTKYSIPKEGGKNHRFTFLKGYLKLCSQYASVK